MSNQIFKYPLDLTNDQTVRMPKGARILTVQMQNGTPTLWALVDADADISGFGGQGRQIRIVGTGHPFQDSNLCDYIGTVQDGGLVWHVWERRP